MKDIQGIELSVGDVIAISQSTYSDAILYIGVITKINKKSLWVDLKSQDKKSKKIVDIHGTILKINESILTKESIDVLKHSIVKNKLSQLDL